MKFSHPKQVAAHMMDSMQEAGMWLADGSPFGSVLGIGRTNNDTSRRFMVVLASNDCAGRLEKWLENEANAQEQAARNAGRQTEVETGNVELNHKEMERWLHDGGDYEPRKHRRF